jgi:hypothetical protein
VSAKGSVINGWSGEDIDRLVQRTGSSRELVEVFCGAVDKHLFMMLGERQRRATLHFHLEAGAFEELDPEDSDLPRFRPPHIE